MAIELADGYLSPNEVLCACWVISPVENTAQLSHISALNPKPVIQPIPPPIFHLLPLLRILFGRAALPAKVALQRPLRSETGRARQTPVLQSGVWRALKWGATLSTHVEGASRAVLEKSCFKRRNSCAGFHGLSAWLLSLHLSHQHKVPRGQISSAVTRTTG